MQVVDLALQATLLDDQPQQFLADAALGRRVEMARDVLADALALRHVHRPLVQQLGMALLDVGNGLLDVLVGRRVGVGCGFRPSGFFWK